VSQPPLIPEVLPPEAPVPPARRDGTPLVTERAPFHPLAATLLIIIDNLWNFADFAVLDWFLTIPLSFLSVFAPTLWIQHRKQGDGWGKALAKALFLGVVAAVPFSVTGTPVGLALLAWAGWKHPWKK
jgi:hypothetical protein